LKEGERERRGREGERERGRELKVAIAFKKSFVIFHL
jgi:hypothetical protein